MYFHQTHESSSIPQRQEDPAERLEVRKVRPHHESLAQSDGRRDPVRAEILRRYRRQRSRRRAFPRHRPPVGRQARHHKPRRQSRRLLVRRGRHGRGSEFGHSPGSLGHQRHADGEDGEVHGRAGARVKSEIRRLDRHARGHQQTDASLRLGSHGTRELGQFVLHEQCHADVLHDPGLYRTVCVIFELIFWPEFDGIGHLILVVIMIHLTSFYCRYVKKADEIFSQNISDPPNDFNTQM